MSTAGAVYEIRRARKAHRCTETSYHTIEPGSQYLYAVCPPWHEFNRSRPPKFETIRACLRCAERFGMHTSETRRQVEAPEEATP